MKTILNLTTLYFTKYTRKHIHLFTLVIFFVMLGLPSFVNLFALGNGGTEAVTLDFGLTLLNYFLIFMAIFLASSAISDDRESKAIQPILARPIPRIYYLIGQYFALFLVLAIASLVLSLALMTSVWLLTGIADPQTLVCAFYNLLEAGIIASICLAVNTVSSTPLAAVMGFFFYIVGGLSNSFIQFFLLEDRNNPLLAKGIQIFKALIPDLRLFRLKDSAVFMLDIPSSYYFMVFFYGLCWTLFILMFGALLFERKDV